MERKMGRNVLTWGNVRDEVSHWLLAHIGDHRRELVFLCSKGEFEIVDLLLKTELEG